MTESKYCEVLMNLRNTGVNTLKSYYANSFNPNSFEKHRSAHTQNLIPPFDKYRESISFLQSPPHGRKYDCNTPYQISDMREARSNSNVFGTHDKMLPYRHARNKLNPGYIGGPSPTDKASILSDVHTASPYRNNSSSYCNGKTPTSSNDSNNNAYCKRTYQNISAQESTPAGNNTDIQTRPNTQAQARFKYTPFRDDTCNAFYAQKTVMDKPHVNNQHSHRSHYDNYRPVPTPCPLPCCSSSSYDIKSIENRNYYERGVSSPPIHSPSISNKMKKMDYPAHAQSLSSREPGENSAFSPIRPSHIRRVHSTESGYSSESNGTCPSVNSYKELELCNKPKCCSTHNQNSPTIGHQVCREIGSQINTTEHRQHMTNDPRNNMAKEQWDHLTNEHRQHIVNNLANHARFQNIQRGFELENIRVPIGEFEKRSKEQTKERINMENTRENIKVNDEYRERRMNGNRCHGNINNDLWREHTNNDKYREYINFENLKRTHTTDEAVRRHKDNDSKHWKSGTDFNRYTDTRHLPAQPKENKLEVCDEASRAAMKAFDAHIRKMIANSRDNNSVNYSSKFQHSINQANHSFNLSIEGRYLCNQSSDRKDTHRQLKNDSSSQLNGRHSVNQLNDSKQALDHSNEQKHSPSSSNNGSDSVQLSNGKDQPCDDKHSSDIPADENTSSNQLCDSTQITENDDVDKKCGVIDNLKHSIEKEKNEVSVIKKDKEEPPSPQPELQCPAVDSTLNDDITSPREVGGLLGLTIVANEHLGPALAKEKKRSKNNNCLHLWQFLRRMLDQEQDKVGRCIEWTNRETGEFRLIKTAVIADLWGQSKNRTCMTYEKMARAMRYYYKMNILEKVPHKRLHFRFGERILSKVLHPSNSKPFIAKPKVYDDMYELTKRNINANYTTNGMLKPNNNIVSEYQKGHNLTYLAMQSERGKNPMPYLPGEIPGVTLPPYYSEHGNNHLHTLPHIVSSRVNDIAPPREFSQKKIESEVFPCNMPRKIISNSVNTSPGSNPSVSPYSGEETPETWSDIDSNDDLVVDTDSE